MCSDLQAVDLKHLDYFSGFPGITSKPLSTQDFNRHLIYIQLLQEL